MEKHKHGRGRKKPVSIDGIVQSGRLIGFSKTSSYRPGLQNTSPALGKVQHKSDGFYPLREAMPAHNIDRSEAEESQMLDEPIVLDHLEEPKRKRRHKGPKHPKLRKFIKRTAFIFMIAILAGGIYFGYKVYHTQRKVLAGGGKSATVCNDNVDTSQLNREGDSRINILLLGIGGPGHEGPDLTDTIMIASIDPITDKIALISIPRDLWVRIPGDGYQKINAAYSYGKQGSSSKTDAGQVQDGLSELDKTLQPVLDGVPIDYHVIIDFTAFKQMVDAVGGVDINVPPTATAYENFWVEGTSQHYLLNVPAGQQHFDGMKALYYARERHNDSDFVRSERQRLVLTALKQKVFSAGTFSNPIKISDLLDSLGNNVYTDFSSNDLRCLYHQTSTIPSSSIASLDMVTPPNNLLTTGTANGLSIVEPTAGLYDYSDIHTFLHQSLKDGLITKENASVAIYNATSTAGLATSETKLLKSYGYNVTVTDNVKNQNDPSTTVLVDLSKGSAKYTKHYLEDRLGITAVSKLSSDYGITPPQRTKFVIILGEDANTSAAR